jgi:Carboxypeptidase regulatory-like domain
MRGSVSIFAALQLLAITAAVAQPPTGTLQGTILDASGGSVPGATVHLTNAGANEAKEIKTDASGRFVVPFLSPGTWFLLVDEPQDRFVHQRGGVERHGRSSTRK